MTNYDAIIIGAGHNGLIAAAYLARAGWRVGVLERRAVIGGAAVTEALFPQCRVSTLSYLCSLLQPQLVAELDLPRYGYRIYPKDPPFFTAFPDGQHLFFWQDTAATVQEIARFSAHDAAAYPAFCAHIETLCAELEAVINQPEPQPSAALRAFSRRSVRDVLEEWFEREEIKTTLATDGLIGFNGGPSTPGTAYNMLHHLMGRAAGARGVWGFVRGGMGAVSNAIAQTAQAHGAMIRTDATVAQIRSTAAGATGVTLANGEELSARVVISNADPKRTFTALVNPHHFPAEFNARVAAFQCEGVSVKLNLLLDGLPNFTAYPMTSDQPALPHRSTMHILPTLDALDRGWAEAQGGLPSSELMLELGLPTVYDDSLAPAGKHLLSIFAQYAPYRLATGKTWDEAAKSEFADRCLATIAQYAPNIYNITQARSVISPADIEAEYGLTGGNIFHGNLTIDQLFERRFGYRTPLANLYLCSSGTYPGGGVLGAAGYHAAQTVLRDARRLR